MSDEQRDDERMHGLLGRSRSVSVPPFEALRRSPTRSTRRSVAVTLATVIVAVAALYGGRELSTYRQRQASPTAGVAAPSGSAATKVTLPQPIPQPITRTSVGAQIAWVGVYPQGQPSTWIGVDAAGRVVGQLPGGQYWRSPDGSRLFGVTDATISAYSAADGQLQQTYLRQLTGGVIDAAFSPDGHWLALILAEQVAVQVIDLRSGLAQTTPLGHDPKAATPGLQGPVGGPVWSTLVYSSDSKHLYTVVDWGRPLRLTAFDVTPTGLAQTATVVSGQGGTLHLPSCEGPGLVARVTPDSRTLVAYCHFDGDVWLIDLATLTVTADIPTGQSNPFEFSPIFTPDGRLVYLRNTASVRVLDLVSGALAGPASPSRRVEDAGPFSWLFTQAAAGYIASTIPISPDGTKLYWSASDGIAVMRVPDLKTIAKLGPGLDLSEVWISGNGKTVYATDHGTGLYAIPEGGGAPIIVPLPAQIGGFIASEHG